MKEELRLVNGALPAKTANAGDVRGLVPGTQIVQPVESKDAQTGSFATDAAARHHFWFLFDPDCTVCAESAKALARINQTNGDAPILGALTTVDAAKASAFLESNGVNAALYRLTGADIPLTFKYVPQYFSVDACGTITHVFSSEQEFLAEVGAR